MIDSERLFGRETLEDLSHGQVVLVTARWILILGALLLAMWNPGEIGELRVQIVVILALAVGNFYLHLQVFKRQAVLAPTIYGASAADLTVITLIVGIGGGFDSNVFVFYFPAILALSVVFPTALTVIYTAAVLVVYGLIGLGTIGDASESVLMIRLVMLAAVAFCGNKYWHIEHGRRQVGLEAGKQLISEADMSEASSEPDTARSSTRRTRRRRE